jgi:hypothetical protein
MKMMIKVNKEQINKLIPIMIMKMTQIIKIKKILLKRKEKRK